MTIERQVFLFNVTQIDTAVTGVTTVYTVPGPDTLILTDWALRLANISVGARTASVYIVPSGDSADDTTLMIDALAIATKTYVDIEMPNMTEGYTVQISGDGGADGDIHAIAIRGTHFAP